MDEGGYYPCVGLDESTHRSCVLPFFLHRYIFQINIILALAWTRVVGYYPCNGVDDGGYDPCIGLDESGYYPCIGVF